MKIGKIGVVVIGLVPFNVYAECTPTPDCASIGYTETSCEGDSLKCPFDTSKLYCIPCDSSFKYDCSGDNITGGIGATCNGKYAGCECSSTDYVFNNGECECPASITATDCVVGAIYYPDGKCSNDYVACLNPVGVVVKDNALVMSWTKSSTIRWGTYGTDVDTLTNHSEANAQADYNGKENTALLVAFQTAEGLTASNSAAIYCNEYAPTGMESSKGQWYLPAAGELFDYLYRNYEKLYSIYTTHLGYSTFSYYFWSSSELNSDYAWGVGSTNDYVYSYDKNDYGSVSCFLAIN